MTTTRTPAHPEPSAAGGRVEGPLAFRRRAFPLVLRLSKDERMTKRTMEELTP